jgi:protein gp37
MAGKFWTASWSPILGCDPSMACARRCWALAMVRRMAGSNTLLSSEDATLLDSTILGEPFGDWSGRHCLIDRWLDKPLHWRKPRVVATGWLGDMWWWSGDEGFDERDRVLSVAFREECDHHQFLHLTKQAEVMAEHLSNYVRPMRDGFPLNQWFGTTITNQADADERIPHLLRIPSRRWLILEPLLGPVDLNDLRSGRRWKEHSSALGYWKWDTQETFLTHFYDPNVDWIVVGQGTNGYYPAKPEWIQSVIEQAQAAGVPVWTKSLPPGVDPVRQAPPEIAAILRPDKRIVADCKAAGGIQG